MLAIKTTTFRIITGAEKGFLPRTSKNRGKKITTSFLISLKWCEVLGRGRKVVDDVRLDSAFGDPVDDGLASRLRALRLIMFRVTNCRCGDYDKILKCAMRAAELARSA